MNRGITIGYGEAGPRVLVGPEVPLREQIRSAKKLAATDVPEVEFVEVWARDNGLVKRRRMKASTALAQAAPTGPEAAAEAEVPGQRATPDFDEDSPVAETGKKRTSRKKET